MEQTKATQENRAGDAQALPNGARIALIYRQNSLYERCEEVLRERLGAQNVVSYVVPQGTPDKDFDPASSSANTVAHKAAIDALLDPASKRYTAVFTDKTLRELTEHTRWSSVYTYKSPAGNISSMSTWQSLDPENPHTTDSDSIRHDLKDTGKGIDHLAEAAAAQGIKKAIIVLGPRRDIYSGRGITAHTVYEEDSVFTTEENFTSPVAVDTLRRAYTLFEERFASAGIKAYPALSPTDLKIAETFEDLEFEDTTEKKSDARYRLDCTGIRRKADITLDDTIIVMDRHNPWVHADNPPKTPTTAIYRKHEYSILEKDAGPDALPRYVCGADSKTTIDLLVKTMLDDATYAATKYGKSKM